MLSFNEIKNVVQKRYEIGIISAIQTSREIIHDRGSQGFASVDELTDHLSHLEYLGSQLDDKEVI